MRPPAHLNPVRELVIVGVAVVEEPAFLDEQSARVDAGRVATVPADRALPDRLGQRSDGASDLLALDGFAQLEMLDPAPAVATDVETDIPDRSRGRRIAFECERAAEHRHRQAALAENTEHAPEADATAIFEHALRAEVAAVTQRIEARAFREAAFRIPVAVVHRGLGALLVAHHEVERDARPAWPFRIRRRSALDR